MLNNDGSLQSITLANPRRFERNDFRKAKSEDLETVPDEFWFNIPETCSSSWRPISPT